MPGSAAGPMILAAESERGAQHPNRCRGKRERGRPQRGGTEDRKQVPLETEAPDEDPSQQNELRVYHSWRRSRLSPRGRRLIPKSRTAAPREL